MEKNPKIKLAYYCDRMRHLICVPYSITNLHHMADDLGIKRCWYHRGMFPHYDLPKRRIVELQSKCIVIEARELLEIIKCQLETLGELTGIPEDVRILALKRRDSRYGKIARRRLKEKVEQSI